MIEDWARTLVPVRAIREHEAGTSGTAYSVVGVAMARWTDLALLRLQPWSDLPAEHNWDNCARLSLRPPAIGSRVYFDTTARFDGGMSGGPVFDESGHLVGIISSSFDGTDDDGDYFSSATLLWPLMGVRLDFPRADAAPGTSYSVLDLADAGLIHVEGRDLVSVERGDEPDTIQIRFHWPG